MKAQFILTAILTFFASTAFAGKYQEMPVSINADARYAAGDMASTRYSAGDLDYIGCGVTSIDDGNGGAFVYSICWATDAAGNSATCFTDNPGLIDSAIAISDFSLLWFAWDETGTICTEIGTLTESSFLREDGKNKKQKKQKKDKYYDKD